MYNRIPHGYRAEIAKNLNVSVNYISMLWKNPKLNKLLYTAIRIEIKSIKKRKKEELINSYT